MLQERLALLKGDELSYYDIMPQILGLNVHFGVGHTIHPLSVQWSQVQNVTVD
jgi:hypothetical protein